MFLPDHRAHRPKTRSKALLERLAEDGQVVSFQGCEVLQEMAEKMPGLFAKPENLFDVFASPALMFQTAGMNVPRSFTQSNVLSSQVDWLASLTSSSPPPDTDPDSDDEAYRPPKPSSPPRRAPLIFPPRTSTLKIPESLLLYSRPPSPYLSNPSSRSKSRSASRKRPKPWGNTFETQALEFASLMRRSVERLEVKERRLWDDELEDWEGLPERRVRLLDVGEGGDDGVAACGVGDGAVGEVVGQWLEDKFGF